MQVSVCLGAILIPEDLDFILAILLQEQNSRNIFRNTFLFRNIPKRTRPKSGSGVYACILYKIPVQFSR